MIGYSLSKSSRWLCLSSIVRRVISNNHRIPLTNFDRKTFDYFYSRRLQNFNGNEEQMLRQIRINIESLFPTSSIINHLTSFNSGKSVPTFSRRITLEQLNDILFIAYEHDIKLDVLTKQLIECLQPVAQPHQSSAFLELINLLVLHQQKHYDFQTKDPNKSLEKLVKDLELNLSEEQLNALSLSDLSLLSSAMYRLQIPLRNRQLLDCIGQHLIADEQRRDLSAVDKQNFIKILTLSNYRQLSIAQALANRFNQSFDEHHRANRQTFSYEIVRMTMRIGLYFSMLRFYSPRFLENCLKLIEMESNSSAPIYRAKDMIQIMNTLVFMGYIQRSNSEYLNLIRMYERMDQFKQNPHRLVDVLQPLAMLGHFPEDLLDKLFTKDHLRQLTESRMKEKVLFISQSYRLLHSPQRLLVDQNYLDALPYHLFGSWKLEKNKRPSFDKVMQRLLECVPSRFHVKSAFLLKHFKSPDIILRLNGDLQPQIIQNEMKNSVSFLDRDEKDDCLYALEVLSEEEISLNEPYRPLGLVFSKARQLQKLTYRPVFIYPNDCLHQIPTNAHVFQWIVERAKSTALLLNAN